MPNKLGKKVKKRSIGVGKKTPRISKKRAFLKFFFMAAIWGGLLLLALLGWFAYDLPDINTLSIGERRPSYVFITKNNQEIARYGDFYGESVQLKDVPAHVIDCILVTEDHKFFAHSGIDWLGLLRAFFVNLKAGHVVQGGSTLTQQVAKNIFLTSERSLKRKIQEFVMAFWLEHHFTKDQLLTIYLNRVYLGAGTYGIDAASQEYFGKPIRSASMAEATVIAALLKAPSRLSPNRDKNALKKRARFVAKRLWETHTITHEQYKNLLIDIDALTFHWAKHFPANRYFTDWLMQQLPEMVDIKQDLIIVTTLDLDLEAEAATVLQEQLAESRAKANAHQAAFAAVRYDGAVVALLGGGDYTKTSFNRATQSKRQAGSAFKLFIYLAALEKDFPLHMKISDGLVDMGGWKPKNFGWKSKGEVTLEIGFINSINTVAVRLAKRVGIDHITEISKRMGLSEQQPQDLTIALGSGSVSPLELTTAYAIVANGGFLIAPYGILEVRDLEGKILYKHKPFKGKQVLSDKVVYQMQKLLRGVTNSGTGRRGNIEGVTLGGKTGTTQKHRDAWFVGHTKNLVAGVWMGNDDEQHMKWVTGATYPIRIWRRIMAHYYTMKK